MIVVGLLLLVISGAIVANAVLTNRGADHAVADGFTIFGYVLQGSTGRLFLYGALTGAAVAVGAYLTVVGARRAVRQRLEVRRELRRAQQEKEAAEQQRDELADKLDRERGADTE